MNNSNIVGRSRLCYFLCVLSKKISSFFYFCNLRIERSLEVMKMGHRKELILFNLWDFIFTYKLINFNTLRDKMMKFGMITRPVNKGWTIHSLTAMALCVGNTRILSLNPYQVARDKSKMHLLKGKKNGMEHNIRTIYKGIFNHLLNSKYTSGGGTMVSNHLLGCWSGNRSTRKTGLGRERGFLDGNRRVHGNLKSNI